MQSTGCGKKKGGNVDVGNAGASSAAPASVGLQWGPQGGGNLAHWNSSSQEPSLPETFQWCWHVLATLRTGSRHTEKLLPQSLKPIDPESGFLESGLVMGQSWFSHDAEKPRPGDELISYLCNSNNPFHGIGSNELFLAEDEDATQFDFYGTIFHASVMAEARQFRRRQQLTRSNLADAVDDDNKHRISPSCTSNGAYIRWHLSFCQRCAFCTGA